MRGKNVYLLAGLTLGLALTLAIAATYVPGGFDLGALWINGTQVTSTAAELNALDGITATVTELNYNDITTLGTSQNSKTVTQSAAGVITIGAASGNQVLNVASHDLVDGGLKLAGTLVTSSAAELNILDGVTASTAEVNYNDITTLGTSQNSKALTQSAAGVVTIGAGEGNQVLDVASHDLVDGGLKLAGTLITASAPEINFNDVSATSAMTPGTGISGGTGTFCKYNVDKVGSLIRTTIVVDLTGLRSTNVGTIIGVDGTANYCYIAQITAAVNGTIFAGDIKCLEAPTGGDPDIDLYSAAESTGVESGLVADLTETQLIDSGDHSAGAFKGLTAYCAANEYLYLVAGAATDADYTAGIIVITLYGY